MAVFDLDDVSAANCDDCGHPLSGDIPPDPVCFHCSRALGRVSVSWQGYARPQERPQYPTIVLHPDCAKELGALLIKDGFNALLITKFGRGAGRSNGVVPSLRDQGR